MTYNSILHITGIKKEVVLPHAKALELEKILQNPEYSADFVIRLQGMTFRKGSVKYLEVLPDGGLRDDNQQNMQQFYEEERKNREKYLSWDKATLAVHVDLFKILFRISAGREANDFEISRAQNIQHDFFRANPKRTLCDLHLFKPIIPIRASTMDVWESGIIALIERAIIRDMQLSN